MQEAAWCAKSDIGMGRSKIAAVRRASLAGAVLGPSCAAASAAFAPQPLRARHTRGVAFTSLEPYTGECLAPSFPEGSVRRDAQTRGELGPNPSQWPRPFKAHLVGRVESDEAQCGMFMPLKNCIARLRLRQPAPREPALPQAFACETERWMSPVCIKRARFASMAERRSAVVPATSAELNEVPQAAA